MYTTEDDALKSTLKCVLTAFLLQDCTITYRNRKQEKGLLQALTTDMGKPIEQAAYWLHLTIFKGCFSWDLTLFVLLFEKNEQGIKSRSSPLFSALYLTFITDDIKRE